MVLLNEAWTCATPSATFLRTFLRTRWAALLAGAFAMVVFQSLLFFQRRGSLAGAFTRTGVGASALTTHRQPTAMTETTVAADVHQSLDVHGGFTPQITLNGVLCNLIPNFLEIRVGQVLDLLGIRDATSFTNFASPGAADSKDGLTTYRCT